VNFERASAYSERHKGQALLVRRDGTTLFERYANDYDPATAHALYSGTKSFWGTLATIARDEGLLALDETVGATFPAWQHGERANVTLRHVLSLTSGIGFGGLGSAVPLYAKALATELKTQPGSTFTYGGIPLQVFGAVLAEKLRPRGLTPHEYLRERILDPIGCSIERWRSLSDGTQPLPTGAFVRASEWVKYGELIAALGQWDGRTIVSPESLLDCFEGSRANPRYGLGWWLSPIVDRKDIAYASGSGGQAMYVLRHDRTVVVRFGDGGSFKHEAFLKHLLAEAEEPAVAVRKSRA
jgi:CubicO group peptidase (beta-lactamase class C family)